MRALAVSLALLAATTSCGSDFDPASRVTSLRILATRADKPFAAPGESVSFEALAVDGNGAPVSVTWATCARPATPSALGCVQIVPRDAPLTRGTSFSLTIPDDAVAGVPEIGRKNVFFGAVQVACPGEVTLEGGPEGLPIRCADAAGTPLTLPSYELAVKRVYVRLRDRNANPTIARVLWDGVEWPEAEVKSIGTCNSATENRFDRCDGEAHALAIVPADDASESGVDELGNAFSEKLLAQYYATEGLFEYEAKDAVRSSTAFKARAGAAGKTLTMWFVVRDDRGGVGWTSRRVAVRP